MSGSTTVNYPTEFKGFAITDPNQWDHPKLTSYQPKHFGPHDIDIEIECCGICASELFSLKNDWSNDPLACLSSKYGPKSQVVGHEIVGRIVAKGEKVTMYNIGQRVGLGAQAYSCLDCSRCKSSNEQYCPHAVGTYCSTYQDGYVSQGGYASHVRALDHFCFPVPESLDSKHVGPLMCGGLTVFSPIKRNIEGITNPRVAIIGIGGLGHMAIMIANALGADVTAFSRGSSKKEDAMKMGAHHFVATSEDNDWKNQYVDSFNLILNCASSTKALQLNDLLPCLKVNRRFLSVGLPHKDEEFDLKPIQFFSNGCTIGSSKLGSRQEAIELLSLAEKHGFKPWIQEIPISEAGVHEGLTKLDRGDVKYRFVLTEFHKFFNTGK